MLEKLSLTELESLVNMCDRRCQILFRKKGTGSSDRGTDEEYTMYFSFIDKLDKELKRRVKEIIEKES